MINELKSYRTAITRKNISRPMQWISHWLGFDKWGTEGVDGYVSAPFTIDYGCGKGYDADHFGMYKIDPHYFPADHPPKGRAEIITCIYVLNVVNKATGKTIIKDIQSLLKNPEAGEGGNGMAYIAVRNDIEKNTDSQRKVKLHVMGWFGRGKHQNRGVLHEEPGFAIYQVGPYDRVTVS